MTVDTLSIENIDEFVNDENKIVTVKWLSLTLQVHCNTAKQLLYKFVQNERNVKDNDSITVTYFVSGLSKPDSSGEKAFKFAVVPEEKLETYKSTLEVLTSCHIYSVQKIKLKDSNALYMTDYEKVKENIFESNKFSSIKNEKASLRSEDELDLLRVPQTTSREEPDKKSSPAVTNGASTAKPAVATSKKGPQSAIASMFAKAPPKQTAKQEQKKEEQKTEKKEENKVEKKETSKSSNKKAGGMMSFFPKQSEKKTESPPQKSEVKPAQVDKRTKGATKKTPRPIDSDEDEDSVGKTKRRRIKPDILDSSSDEEDMEPEDEEPIPPTPPRQPSPAPREPTPEPEPETITEEEEPVKKKSSDDAEESRKGDYAKSSSKGGNSGESKRKRTKKLVPKTYMDKDGFMVTEKVWESESTDASEAEEPVPKAAKPKASPVKGKQKGSPKKKSPAGKKGPGSAGNAKQTSLMSFFKKS